MAIENAVTGAVFQDDLTKIVKITACCRSFFAVIMG
jgi:hypothetical protein